jgi:hypothetical protein
MNSNWLYKIQQHEAAPPEGAWKNIAGKLDETENTNFATRLASFETTPPTAAQKNIFALLDKDEANSPFEKRLYDYETAAPESVWPQIVNDLDGTAAKIISFKKPVTKLKPIYLRVAAAVAVIALLSISVWLLNRQPAGVGQIANADVKPQQPAVVTNSNPAQNSPAVETPVKQNTNTVNAAINPAGINKTVTQNFPEQNYVANTETITLAQNPANGNIEKLQNSNGETPEDVTLINSNANSYLSITGPDGQPVRVSAKFAALLNYLNDNNPATQENIEVIINESAKWRATFAAWREKMTNNTIAPSLTNFMDVIELSNMLEEKK